jgi:hypothetical protein
MKVEPRGLNQGPNKGRQWATKIARRQIAGRWIGRRRIGGRQMGGGRRIAGRHLIIVPKRRLQKMNKLYSFHRHNLYYAHFISIWTGRMFWVLYQTNFFGQCQSMVSLQKTIQDLRRIPSYSENNEEHFTEQLRQATITCCNLKQ